ncbi:MAG TPA: dihydrofolate reductase family protein [Cyclobacteriaceae bacterium]|jgi:dihydrofolate reductase|nr:dihydrofolate reductase family protein [Cyclobacteriaceae bacterium]
MAKFKTKSNSLRKLIFGINLTLDGCCDHTKGIANEEVHDYFTQLLHEVDTLVYGRITYQLMVPFWPDIAKSNSSTNKAMNHFAHAFNSVGKIVVFSKTLDRAEEKNTKIVSTGLQKEILKLKQEPGKNILVGGVDIPTQLIQLGLVDEYRFVVQPILAGQGRRLLDGIDLQKKLKLKLVESKIFKSGCAALRYVKS